ncbi:MAG: cyclic nucleotide-binding domain-containing protein [Verrucomicrobiaceae bacterium]|nr:cyclic nucleotide-binding domain-containing protein [Verrucomicrobiaceae bacterium]
MDHSHLLERPAKDDRPIRWREPFGLSMDEADVDKLLRMEPFCNFSEEAFPAMLPLRGILRNDTRIRRFKKGQFVVREGDYGNSAFLILEGRVRPILDSLPQELLGRGTVKKRSMWNTIARVFRQSPYPESRPYSGAENIADKVKDAFFLQDIPRVIDGRESVIVESGELFGEIAALGRTPRVATVIAEDDDTTLLEIRWQGLRDIGRFAPEWYAHVDDNYRKHGLHSHLRATAPIDRLTQDAQQYIAEQTRFLRYGSFDWQHKFKRDVKSMTLPERLKSEPVVIKEEDYLNGLYLVRAGFVRVTRNYNKGEKTVAYLGKGQSFGLHELVHNHENDAAVGSRNTVRALGYVDILLIPTHVVDEHILPALSQQERSQLSAEGGQRTGLTRETNDLSSMMSGKSEEINDGLVEFILDHRAINGTAAMLIDLDRCTRCDDCVRACASTHENNPRFIRHGPATDGIQFTNACLHCIDPVCMLECPTGAIHREEDEGNILINDYTCIGCASCANACPYDNIQMVPITDKKGIPQYPVEIDSSGKILRQKTWEEPFMKATKCDLCSGQKGGPACVNACPHDALVRTDMRDLPGLVRWLNR